MEDVVRLLIYVLLIIVIVVVILKVLGLWMVAPFAIEQMQMDEIQAAQFMTQAMLKSA